MNWLCDLSPKRSPMTTRINITNTTPLATGRYTVAGLANLGAANVYRARDPEGGLVAVYLYTAQAIAKDQIAARLASAFEACAALEHPNILRVLDHGQEGSHGYLVTEWVEGTTLGRQIELHGRLPEGNVIRFAAQLGQALDHTRYGDEAICRLTPSAVLVRNDGLAKLIPFTLPETSNSAEAPALLKPQYAASLALNNVGVKRVPFAEAMFSLGTLTYEALTGMAWTPPKPRTSHRRSRRQPSRPAGLTDKPERAIRRATDPEPTNRPASGAEFLKLLRGRPMTAGTPKPDTRNQVAADDRRGCERYSVGVGTIGTIHTSVFDGSAPADSQEVWPLVVQDVSASGIGILLARRCEPGTELSVEVALGPNQPSWNLQARVVRVRKDNYGHWMHGCVFLDPLNDEELAALLGHIGRTDL
jgi:serine/threonine protein kinase